MIAVPSCPPPLLQGPPLRTLAARCARWLLATWLLLSAGPVLASVLGLPDLLSSRTPLTVEAWPAVRWMPEAGTGWTLEQARAAHEGLLVPDTPRANLGVRRTPVWLQLTVQAGAVQEGRWLLDIDYPSIDRVEVFLLRDGRLEQQALLGDHLPVAERPMPHRALNVPLRLSPGQAHELWLRVETTSSMILPIRLISAPALARYEAAMQFYQGIAGGIGLCLAIYALAHWIGTRDASFLWYACAELSITAFFYALEGVGPQHWWEGSEWLTRNGGPFWVLAALVCGLGFLDRTLRVGELMPRVALAMRTCGVIAALALVGFVLGWVDYRGAHLVGSVLGPTPILLGLPVAWARARDGDRGALYILIGWGIYSVGIVLMALLLRGLVEANPVTMHAFQAGSVLEMTMWLRALGVRLEELRQEAERSRHEREALRSLAHTDPLTGLANRRGLMQALDERLPRARPGQMLATYVLDLDGFKAVNDRYGHDAGDELLCEVARRLQDSLRASDLVARLGGDEFVVVADGLESDAAAQRIGEKLLDAVLRPIVVRGEPCQVGVTVGFALVPLDANDAPSLLKRADAAMYGGKQDGKSCVRRGGASHGLA